MNGDFINVGEALNLVPQSKGIKHEVLVFIGNIDTAFSVINPSQEAILYKFVLTRIIGEPSKTITHRNLKNLAVCKEFLQNAYVVKQTIYFPAIQLFKAKQRKDENVAE
jgi:hypothetical protein